MFLVSRSVKCMYRKWLKHYINETDYNNGNAYQLLTNVNGDICVGSTTQSLHKHMFDHTPICNKLNTCNTTLY